MEPKLPSLTKMKPLAHLSKRWPTKASAAAMCMSSLGGPTHLSLSPPYPSPPPLSAPPPSPPPHPYLTMSPPHHVPTSLCPNFSLSPPRLSPPPTVPISLHPRLSLSPLFLHTVQSDEVHYNVLTRTVVHYIMMTSLTLSPHPHLPFLPHHVPTSPCSLLTLSSPHPVPTSPYPHLTCPHLPPSPPLPVVTVPAHCAVLQSDEVHYNVLTSSLPLHHDDITHIIQLHQATLIHTKVCLDPTWFCLAVLRQCTSNSC